MCLIRKSRFTKVSVGWPEFPPKAITRLRALCLKAKLVIFITIISIARILFFWKWLHAYIFIFIPPKIANFTSIVTGQDPMVKDVTLNQDTGCGYWLYTTNTRTHRLCTINTKTHKGPQNLREYTRSLLSLGLMVI
jgi:hypothetical protein